MSGENVLSPQFQVTQVAWKRAENRTSKQLQSPSHRHPTWPVSACSDCSILKVSCARKKRTEQQNPGGSMVNRILAGSNLWGAVSWKVLEHSRNSLQLGISIYQLHGSSGLQGDWKAVFTLLGGRMFVLPVKRHLSLIQFDSAMYCFTALSSVKGFLGSLAEGMLMYWKLLKPFVFYIIHSLFIHYSTMRLACTSSLHVVHGPASVQKVNHLSGWMPEGQETGRMKSHNDE